MTRTQRSRPKSSRPRGILSGARTLGIYVFAALLLRSFLAEAYVIPSGSMEPTLLVGDRVLVNKASYGMRVPFTDHYLVRWGEPRRGEVVIFSDPQGTGETLIKRVVAVGGDRVQLRENTLWVNGAAAARVPTGQPCRVELAPGQQLPCRRFEEQMGAQHYTVQQIPRQAPFTTAELTVPPGHCFVLGDSRDNSNDSRFWGTVPYERVRGRALGILWSWGDGGLRLRRTGAPMSRD